MNTVFQEIEAGGGNRVLKKLSLSSQIGDMLKLDSRWLEAKQRDFELQIVD